MSSAGRVSSPVFPRTTSAPRDNSGAIPSTTGTLCAGPATVGGWTACAPCSPTWTSFAWIISAAFAAAWHVPAGAPTAQTGRWVPGPGPSSFSAVQKELGGLPFIAEDLGLITPDVIVLRDRFQLPGTRVLQFAFDGHADNPYLPSNYVANTVVYTGTHDNPTTRGWYEELPDDQRQNFWSYLKRPGATSGEAAPALMESGLVVDGRARDRAAAGRAQPGDRGPDERARPRRGQLALALHGRDAVRPGLRMAARSDEGLEPHGSSGE